MTTRIKLKPAEGCLVRHPGSYNKLAEEGESVEQNSYWLRKLKAGDVIDVDAVPESAASADAKGAKQ